MTIAVGSSVNTGVPHAGVEPLHSFLSLLTATMFDVSRSLNHKREPNG
ncbi:hypothetical protein [Pseudanabaena sp. PCC 6802]|nr:hypothetical protein [Pseudanabaena sp. PCC 6802]